VSATTHPVKTIARLLDLTERRVQQLAREGVIPKAENGRYDLVAAVRGYVKYLRDRAMGGGAPPDAHAERARLLKANADKVELDLAERRQELVPVDEAAALLERVIVAVRARVLAIPTRAAPLVRGKRRTAEVRDVLQTLTDEVLHEIAAIDPADLGPGGEAEAGAAAPAPDGEPVGGP